MEAFMALADWLRFSAQLPGGFEWIIILIIIAILLLFGPQKLPELAKGIGRALGEFRRGKLEVERQIRQEFSAEEARDSSSRLMEAAKELGINTSGKPESQLKLEIARKIDTAADDHVAIVARLLGATESGATPIRLRELIIKVLGV